MLRDETFPHNILAALDALAALGKAVQEQAVKHPAQRATISEEVGQAVDRQVSICQPDKT